MSGAYGSKASFPIWAQGPGTMGPMFSDMGLGPMGPTGPKPLIWAWVPWGPRGPNLKNLNSGKIIQDLGSKTKKNAK